MSSPKRWNDASFPEIDFADILDSEEAGLVNDAGSQKVWKKGTLKAYLDTLYHPVGIKATVTKDIASIAAGAEGTETFAVTGAETTDTVSVSAASGLSAGLIITNAWVSAADTVSVTFYNWTGSPIDQGSKDFYISFHN